MNKLIKYIFTRFIFFILIAFTAFGCNHMNTTPPNNIEMVNLLIKPDDMPSGWIVEFPAGPFHAAEYEEEAEKIEQLQRQAQGAPVEKDGYRMIIVQGQDKGAYRADEAEYFVA